MKILFQFTKQEMEEELMSAWVDGWYSRQEQLEGRRTMTDDGKRVYAKNRILRLLEKGEN